ncbi:MAG: MMPL family transporter [Planctomycetaceae bacterium]|nr:MMPL family transporter [Planctomycetaceae bacterium]
MNPIAAAVKNPYTVAVAVILSLLFSYLALTSIPIQLKPTVDVPRITVTTIYRGAGAQEVEEEVTRELEDVLQAAEGLAEMISESTEGQSTITLEYDFGQDMQLAVIDVTNKLTQRGPLPAEAEEPAVKIASANDRDRMMWVAVRSGYDPNRVARILEDSVRARLERVPGVSDILVVGGEEREVQVRIDPEAMVARGVSFAELSSAISAGNLNLRGGTLDTEERRIQVRTLGRADIASELGRLIVRQTDAGPVRLSEVATVVDSYRKRTSFVNVDGGPGAALGIGRQVGANVVSSVAALQEEIAAINENFRQREVDIFLEPVYLETTYIDAALQFVQDNLILGSVLAISVLLVFLQSFRSILVVALSIPISLAAVFLVLKGLDRSLNVISLAGLAFASGMVVDNAIVVLENIFRHLEMGKDRVRAAIDGGAEVWGGVLASTLTTVAVFIPILLGADEASALFTDMALAISAAVLLSLVVALSVVPVLSSLLFGKKESSAPPSEGPSQPLGWVGRTYGGFMDRLVSNRYGGGAFKLGMVLLLAAGSAATYRLAPPAEYLPSGNRNLIFFFASPIPGQRPERIQENFAAWEGWVMAQPETARMFAVSAIGFNGGGVILKPEYGNAKGLTALYDRMFMQSPAFALPGFLFFVPVRSSLFDDAGKQFEVQLSGPDFATLEATTGKLMGMLGGLEGVDAVRPSLVSGQPQILVEVDELRAKDLGVSVAEIGAVVETAVAGRRLTRLIDGGREVEVNVLAPADYLGGIEGLRNLRFVTDDGRTLTLGSVADVRTTTGPQSIRRLERERNVLFEVNIAQSASLETMIERVEQEVFPAISADLGPAYSLELGGSADKLRATLNSLSQGFGLSVLIVYLLLVSLFRSWFTPFVILVTVPLALSGGVLGIVVAGDLSAGQAAFDVLAMLGFIILAGLVVNNAILIVHQANNFVAEGMEPRPALAESAKSRLRPILMSVITTVMGMLPLAIGGGAGAELYQGLGAILVGGLLVSTVFTLFLVPLMLSLGHDVAERIAARRNRSGPKAAQLA